MRDNNEALKFVNIKLFNIAEEAAICRIASLKWHQFCYRNTDYLSTFVINDGMQELVRGSPIPLCKIHSRKNIGAFHASRIIRKIPSRSRKNQVIHVSQ